MIGIFNTIDGYEIVWKIDLKGIGTITREVGRKELIKHFPGLCTFINLKDNYSIQENDSRFSKV